MDQIMVCEAETWSLGFKPGDAVTIYRLSKANISVCT